MFHFVLLIGIIVFYSFIIQAIIDAASYVPPPPSEEQKKKIAKLYVTFNT